MNKLDFLLEIRKEFEARVCNYGLQSVLTEKRWQELVNKCISSDNTGKLKKKLMKSDLPQSEIKEILNADENGTI